MKICHSQGEVSSVFFLTEYFLRAIRSQVNPVELAIERFGGPKRLAEAIGRDRTAIVKWKTRGGAIPTAVQKIVLDAARRRKIKLTPTEIILGGTP